MCKTGIDPKTWLIVLLRGIAKTKCAKVTNLARKTQKPSMISSLWREKDYFHLWYLGRLTCHYVSNIELGSGHGGTHQYKTEKHDAIYTVDN